MATKTCDNCGEAFEAQRETKRYCSDSCRVTANRKDSVTDGGDVTVKKEPAAPKTSPIDPPERSALIEAIRAGTAKGSLEDHPKWGMVIVRTAAEAREYDEALANERHRLAQASKKHDFQRKLWSNPKGS